MRVQSYDGNIYVCILWVSLKICKYMHVSICLLCTKLFYVCMYNELYIYVCSRVNVNLIVDLCSIYI